MILTSVNRSLSVTPSQVCPMLPVTCQPPGPRLAPIMSHWRWSRADWDEMPGPGPAQWPRPAWQTPAPGQPALPAHCPHMAHGHQHGAGDGHDGQCHHDDLILSDTQVISLWPALIRSLGPAHFSSGGWWPVHSSADITPYIPHTPLCHTAWALTLARDSPGLSPLTIFPNLFVSEVNIFGNAWLFIGLRSGLACGAGARGERRFWSQMWSPNGSRVWETSIGLCLPGPAYREGSWLGNIGPGLCVMIRRWPPITTVPSNSRGHLGLLICFIGVRRWFKSWCRMRYHSWNCTFCL